MQHLEHLGSPRCHFCMASAALGAISERSAEVRQRLSTMDAGRFCVAGAALGGPQCHLAWQVQHLAHLSVILRGTCSTRRGSPATLAYYGRRLLLRGRCSTIGEPPERFAEVRRQLSTMGAGCFCVAGAKLGGPQCHFARQVQHLGHLSVILRGRCSTRSISAKFCVAGAALGDCFCVASAALGGPQSHFAWQVQHSEHLSVILRGRCSSRSTSREVRGSPATIEYYGRRPLLRGRCSTWRTLVSFCVAGAALGARQCHFAWQVQHSEHLQRGPRKSGDD